MSDRFIKITRCGDCPHISSNTICRLTNESVEFGEIDENCPLDVLPPLPECSVVDEHPTECECAFQGKPCPHMADWPSCVESEHGCPYEPLMKPLYGPRCLASVETELTVDRMNSEGCDGRPAPNGADDNHVCHNFVSPDEFVCPGCYGKGICRTGPGIKDFVKCARCDGKHKLKRGVDE